MATATARKFTSAIALRTRVPLIIGIAGPSGTGKTKSALRLADGMARVDTSSKRWPDGKGHTAVIDTEARRALHYAGQQPGQHTFHHIEFPPPHSPDDYLGAIDYAIAQGAGRIIIDSMSHEHDGEGGVLQMHDEELQRLGGDPRFSLQAWGPAKRRRRALINRMNSSGVDFILCFRADEKTKPVKGKAPINMGFTPVGGREYMFEMVVKLLLLPGAKGVPTFRTSFPGEEKAIKLPGQFEALFDRRPQLSEDIGEQFARWAGGGDVAAVTAPSGLPDLLTRMGACNDAETLAFLDDEAKSIWSTLDPAGKKRLDAAGKAAHMRVRMLEAQAAEAARAMSEAAKSDGDEDDQGYGGAPVDESAA
jgi:hypothetical protein